MNPIVLQVWIATTQTIDCARALAPDLASLTIDEGVSAYLNTEQKEVQVEVAEQDELVQHRHHDRGYAVAENGQHWVIRPVRLELWRVEGGLRGLEAIVWLSVAHFDCVVFSSLIVTHCDGVDCACGWGRGW